MCATAAIPVLKFIAPMVLPSLAQRIFGGNKQQQGGAPANFQQTATPGSKIARQMSSTGEDIETRDETKKLEANTNPNQKLARKRELNPFQDLGASKMPLADAFTSNLGNLGLGGGEGMDAMTGINNPVTS